MILAVIFSVFPFLIQPLTAFILICLEEQETWSQWEFTNLP